MSEEGQIDRQTDKKDELLAIVRTAGADAGGGGASTVASTLAWSRPLTSIMGTGLSKSMTSRTFLFVTWQAAATVAEG